MSDSDLTDWEEEARVKVMAFVNAKTRRILDILQNQVRRAIDTTINKTIFPDSQIVDRIDII